MSSGELGTGPIFLLTEEVEQKLHALGAEVRTLRNRLVHIEVSEETSRQLAALQGELSRLDSELEHQLSVFHRLEREASASMVLEYLRSLDLPFRAIGRRWAELRGAVGVAAATEMRDASDVEVGWRERWGGLFEVAFDLRRRLDERPRRPAGDRSSGRPEGGLVFRGVTANFGLMLDLRYGVGSGMPLAQIAELLNVSPALIQMRVADFEERVAGKVAADEIREQLREGWRLVVRGDPEHYLLRPPEGQAGYEPISVGILFARDDRDGTAGRPRVFQQATTRRRQGRSGHIWAVVAVEAPQVTFVPESRLERDSPPAHIVAIAQERALENLMQAIEIEQGGGGEKDIEVAAESQS